MGDALLFGGSGGGGLRNKRITKRGYESLSDADKNNPYIIWIITDDDGSDFGATGTESVVKIIHWEAYNQLAESDKLDPRTVWVIADVPTSPEQIKGVDYALNRESYNPIANCAITKEIEEIKLRLGGLSFGVTEAGGLRIEYDDGTPDGKE